MASLTGQTIQSTYDSLLKVTDNGPITSSLKAITDGLGNNTALELSTLSAKVNGAFTATSLVKLGGTASQILAADGSVITAGSGITISAGTISSSGTISGSGTANYIPKFATSTSLGDSNAFNDTYGIGLDFSNIGGRVQFYAKNTSSNGYSAHTIENDLGDEGYILMKGSALSDPGATFLGASDKLIFEPFYTEAARFITGGKLLIGSTTDDGSGAKLQLSGSAQFNSASGETFMSLANNVSSQGSAYYIGNNNSDYGYWGMHGTTHPNGTDIYFGGNKAIEFYPNDSLSLRLTTDGKALIGTSTDNGSGAKLQVNGQGTFLDILDINGSTIESKLRVNNSNSSGFSTLYVVNDIGNYGGIYTNGSSIGSTYAGVYASGYISLEPFNVEEGRLVSGGLILGGTSKNAAAKFQVDSTTQGVLTPRMTVAQRNAISNPPAGLEIFNTDDNWKEYYDPFWGWMPIAVDSRWKNKYGNEYFNDFGTDGTISDGNISSANVGAGSSSNSNISAPSNRFGILNLNCGTTTTGVSGIRQSFIGTSAVLKINDGIFSIEEAVLIPTLSTSTDRFVTKFGLTTIAFETITQSNAVMIIYDEGGVSTGSAVSGNFQCLTASASSRTYTTTSVSVTANQWYKLRIDINSTGTEVKFYIDNILVATHTTNIPTGSNLNIVSTINKSAGTSSRNKYIDYISFRKKFNSAR